MSDAPQGPGWWLASDGKYYPPQGGAAAAPPVPAPPVPAPPVPAPPGAPMGGMPMGGMPMGGMPMAPIQPVQMKKSGKGCLWAVLISGIVIAVLTVGFIVVLGRYVNDNVGGFGCDAISQGDAEAIIGGGVSMFSTGSQTAGLNNMFDDRILSGEKGCDMTRIGAATGQISQAGLIKVDKSDAAAVYQAELAKAKAGTSTAPTVSVPSVPGVSIPTITTGTEGGPYYLKDAGLGDESFCTKTNFFDASGVLVRKGNTLVYATVQVSGAVDKDYSEGNCDIAKKLAQKALG